MDYDYTLEEFPIFKGDGSDKHAVGFCNGTASLVWNMGEEFTVADITIDTIEGYPIHLSSKADDRELRNWFFEMEERIRASLDAQEEFAEALAEYRFEGAA